MTESVIIHAYDWTVEDGFSDDGRLAIHGWCLDRDSNPYLLRIEDFPVFCHIELPRFVGGRPYKWDEPEANLVIEWLQRRLGEDHAPIGGSFAGKNKVYYYRNLPVPMLFMMFPTELAMRKCHEVLSVPIGIENIGVLVLKMWEYNSKTIPTVRKLLSYQKLRYSQWFSINVTKVDDDNKITLNDHEYFGDWRSIKPLPPSETKGWLTKPRLLAFDIECYAQNHNAMPNKYSISDVAYMVSCIYQKVGDPSTRKRYGIVIGDCEDVKIVGNCENTGYEHMRLGPTAKDTDTPWCRNAEIIPGDRNVEIIRVKDELGLIEETSRLIRELDPEIISGYNILSFDYPYLDQRRKLQGPKMPKWPQLGRILGKKSEMEKKEWKSGAYGFNSINILRMDGRISIDLMPVIKRDYKLDSYGLGAVSKNFLGNHRDKHDIKADEMFKIYDQTIMAQLILDRANGKFVLNPDDDYQIVPPEMSLENAMIKYNEAKREMTRVMCYCIEDSELVVDLFGKLDLWIGLVELSNIVGVTIMDLFTRGQQIRCISQIYDLASSLGFVIDSRDTTNVKFTGGYVYEPTPGLYENIICLDFASLYPSIIQESNICPTTLVAPEHMEQIPDECCHVFKFEQEEEEEEVNYDDPDNEDPDVKKKKKKEIKKRIIKHHYKFVKAPEEGVNNPFAREGLFPQLVRNLVAERRLVKGQLEGVKDKTGKVIIEKERDPTMCTILDKRQWALKITANSFFGFLGVRNGGILPLIEGAISITYRGRQLINQVNEYLKDQHHAKIIYGDSVTADTPILVQRGGNVYYVRISDLAIFGVDNIRADQKEEVNMETSGIEVWSDQGWTKLKRVIRHHTQKQIFRVLTHTGCIDVTEDHSLLRPDGTEISPNNIQVGEYLMHHDLPNHEQQVAITEEAAWVWGLFYAEGCCGYYHCLSGNKASWAISNQEVGLLERAGEILKRMYPQLDFYVEYYMESSNCNKLQVRGNGIADLVREYRQMFYTGPSDTTAENSFKVVPPIILNASTNIKCAFMNGYYAGDGVKNNGCDANRLFDNKVRSDQQDYFTFLDVSDIK